MVKARQFGLSIFLLLLFRAGSALADASTIEHGGPVLTEELDRTDNSSIFIRAEVSNTKVWIKQAVHFVLQYETSSRFVSFEMQTPTQAGMEIIAIPLSHREIVKEGKRRYLHQLGWVIIPLSSGNSELQLPAIKYSRHGTTVHEYTPPVLALQVRPLPAYIPVTMPVGTVSVDARLPDKSYLISRHLSYLSLTLTGTGMSDQSLHNLTQQFKSDRHLVFYPAQVEVKREISARNIVSHVHYRIPLSPRSSGLIILPPIRLQYFNPDSGKIETHEYQPGKLVVLSQWLVYVLYGLAIATMLVLLRLVYRSLMALYARHRQYLLAIRLIHAADHASAYRQALRAIARAEHWPANLSLQRWLHYWNRQYPHLRLADVSLLPLQEACYGRDKTRISELRSSLLEMCYRRQPMLKFLPLLNLRKPD